MTYYEFVKSYMGVEACPESKKYSPVGHAFAWYKKEIDGLYWFYQGQDFIIDIHDFYIKEELVQTGTYSMADYMSIYTSYCVSANGERFSPYQTLTPHSLYSLDFDQIDKNFRFLLHKDSYYLTVSIGFKRSFLDRHLSSLHIDSRSFYTDLFLSQKTILTRSLEPLALDILHCKMQAPAADLFFQAKANEWISIIIDTFLNRSHKKIGPDDKKALEDVVRYLDDHFSMAIRQETLEKISLMSGTKLKKLFKDTYQQTITEYIQRKRMNMAEILLLNSQLPIQEIAKSVGYTSPSKFSSYYKKYKGKLPSDLRKADPKPPQHKKR